MRKKVIVLNPLTGNKLYKYEGTVSFNEVIGDIEGNGYEVVGIEVLTESIVVKAVAIIEH